MFLTLRLVPPGILSCHAAGQFSKEGAHLFNSSGGGRNLITLTNVSGQQCSRHYVTGPELGTGRTAPMFWARTKLHQKMHAAFSAFSNFCTLLLLLYSQHFIKTQHYRKSEGRHSRTWKAVLGPGQKLLVLSSMQLSTGSY